MKKIATLVLVITLLGMAGCDNDNIIPVNPSTISNIQTEALPGAIKISWTRDEPVKFEYIEIAYFDHLKEKEMVRLASSYSDTILIPNTRAKYGDYHFTLQPFSITENAGQILEVSGKSGPAPISVSVVDAMPVVLDPDKLYTDAPERTEGPIANLIDGNNNSYFHSSWSVNYGPMPHYIVVDLGKKVNGISFSYVTRNHGNVANHPSIMNIYVSNSFDDYNTENAVLVDELTNLPSKAGQTFDSENYVLDDDYQYVWFEVNKTHGNSTYFALAELAISELILEIIDPEAD
ncbi:MAG: discoidin domain-containing protein [Fermentimonas sp.]|nr:discoidin domain-containing protein [Fermentimonas sp.]